MHERCSTAEYSIRYRLLICRSIFAVRSDVVVECSTCNVQRGLSMRQWCLLELKSHVSVSIQSTAHVPKTQRVYVLYQHCHHFATDWLGIYLLSRVETSVLTSSNALDETFSYSCSISTRRSRMILSSVPRVNQREHETPMKPCAIRNPKRQKSKPPGPNFKLLISNITHFTSSRFPSQPPPLHPFPPSWP